MVGPRRRGWSSTSTRYGPSVAGGGRAADPGGPPIRTRAGGVGSASRGRGGMVDAADLKSAGREAVQVRSLPPASSLAGAGLRPAEARPGPAQAGSEIALGPGTASRALVTVSRSSFFPLAERMSCALMSKETTGRWYFSRITMGNER